MKAYVLAILALSLPVALTKSCNVQEESLREPVTVKAMRVEYTDNVPSEVFVGRIEPSKSSVITAPFTGKLVKIKVRKGQKVIQGEALAVIDSPGIVAVYESAKANYEQAKDGLQRVEKVYSTGSVTEAKLIEIKTQFAKTEAALNAAQRELDNCCVKAPYNGVISECFMEEGMELAPSAPLFQLLDINTVEVHASVPENEYSKFLVGQKAKVEVAAVEMTADAVLTDKGLESSPLSHSYDFTFRIKDVTTGIMPGMVCKVMMNRKAGKSIVIPSSAVRVDGDGRYVWCIDAAGAVEKRHVSVGGFASDGVVIEKGLKVGDILVVEGGRKISSGMTDLMITGI